MRKFFIILIASWMYAASTLGGPRAQARCSLTQIDRYEYYCDTEGSIQDPEFLTPSTSNTTWMQCMRSCQSKEDCKSYRYLKKTGTCQLFSAYLTSMAFDPAFKQPGRVSDRDCYTTDCNVIQAYNATAGKCDTASDYEYEPFVSTFVEFARYAVSYGHTARKLGFNYEEHTINGTSSACAAIQNCVETYPLKDYYNYGSIDIHWNIPKNLWVCRQFADKMSIAKRRYESYDEVHATHSRYTAKNASVGAGYGYYALLDSVYIGPF